MPFLSGLAADLHFALRMTRQTRYSPQSRFSASRYELAPTRPFRPWCMRSGSILVGTAFKPSVEFQHRKPGGPVLRQISGSLNKCRYLRASSSACDAIAHFFPESTYAASLDPDILERAKNRRFRTPQVGARAICPHCGAPNAASMMDALFAFVCAHCGAVVTLDPPKVQSSAFGSRISEKIVALGGKLAADITS